jgi:hypothetical protein
MCIFIYSVSSINKIRLYSLIFSMSYLHAHFALHFAFHVDPVGTDIVCELVAEPQDRQAPHEEQQILEHPEDLAQDPEEPQAR